MVALLNACACNRGTSDPQVIYQQILLKFQHSEFTLAQNEAQEECVRHAADSPVWSWKFRLLEAEIMADRGLNQEVLSTLAPDLPQHASNDLVANKLALEALALANTGNVAEADRDLSTARSLCDEQLCDSASKIARIAGVVEIRKNSPERAQIYFRRSLELARHQKNEMLEAAALQNMGVVALEEEHFDESISWSEQAREVAHNLGSSFGEEKASGNLGWAYFKLGDFERALQYFATTAGEADKLGAVKDETIWLNNLGLVYFETNQLGSAGQYYHRSLDLAQKTQSADLILASLNALAFLAVKTNDIPSARNFSQQALDLARRVGDHADEQYALLAQGQIAAASSDSTTAENLFIDVARDLASDTSARWEAQNSLAKLYESENRAAAANKAYRQAIATVESARSSIQHEDFRLPFLANAAHLYDDYIHFLITHGKNIQALQAADYSRAQTLEEGLELRGAKDGTLSAAPTEIGDIARRANATILFYWLGPEHSYLWAINSRQTKFVSLPSAADIGTLVEHYNRILSSGRDPLELASTEGTELYKELVKPVQNLIRPNSRVIIIPDGNLNTLNFETLLVPQPRLHYWIEDVTVLTTTSLRLLRESRVPERGNGKLLLIGDPSEVSADYGTLPNAGLEIEKIERHFPAGRRAVYVRQQAAPEAYLENHPEQFAFIHFVAHGTASTLSPLDSSVVLSPDSDNSSSPKLYARDVIAHPLRAELVTISSCYGAGTRVYTGEGLVGLSWSFLRAGASNVIGALWAVSDTSTPNFMDDFYNGLTKGEAPETALRLAKIHMLDSKTVYRKPFYWAPFQLYTQTI